MCSGWPKDALEDKFWSCSDRFHWFPAISKTFFDFSGHVVIWKKKDCSTSFLAVQLLG